jgi:hypothetical protein
MHTDGTGVESIGAQGSSGIEANAPKYGDTSSGKYADSGVSFDYPEKWVLSTNNAGLPLVTGIEGGVKYQLSVLDITNDTTSDIFEYTVSKEPDIPQPGMQGSIGNRQVGNYSGVATGYLYMNGDTEGSVSMYCITDGKKRVVIATWCFNDNDSSYNDQIYQNIIRTFVINE